MNVLPTRLSVATFLVFLWAGNPTGQEASPLLTINDITKQIGTDVDARHVFGTILTHAMAQSHREFFLASQIRTEWLPVIQNVEFVRLADSEIPQHLSRCGTYWIIDQVMRAGDVVSVHLSAKCGAATLNYVVSFDGHEWHLGPPGTGKDGFGWVPGHGSGLGGRSAAECPCGRGRRGD